MRTTVGSHEDRSPRWAGLASRALGRGTEAVVRDLLAIAGIEVGGSQPWDPQVRDNRFYGAVLQGSLGLGESYMDGWWECELVDELISRLLRAELDKTVPITRDLVVANLKANLFNMQRSARAYANVAHYDVGNELFEQMLGPTMAYSCGYWRNATSLDEAQRHKFELICRKLMLAPGQRLLDIGCGFGTLARYAAETYGCSVVGITLAHQQHAYGRTICDGLPVDLRIYDYRDPRLRALGPFDKIVSVGMFEHVGVKNYRRYMEVVSSLLHDDGLFLLQTIGTCVSRQVGDPWLNKYFYPNGMLPSPANLNAASEGLLVLEDLHSFGADYDRTLMCWHENFERHAASPAFRQDRRFYRMWRYYLLMLAGAFRARNKNQLWQVLFSRRGMPGGYLSVR